MIKTQLFNVLLNKILQFETLSVKVQFLKNSWQMFQLFAESVLNPVIELKIALFINLQLLFY